MSRVLSFSDLEQIAHNLCSLHGFDVEFVAKQEAFAKAVIVEYERLPDHISSTGEKVEPANGEVAAAVERISAALYRAEEIGTERVLFGRQGPGIVLSDLRTILTALRAQPNGGAK